MRSRDLGLLSIIQINSSFAGRNSFFGIWFRACSSLVLLSEIVLGAVNISKTINEDLFHWGFLFSLCRGLM